MPKIDIDLSGAKVLVVDDLPDNLDVLCRSLEDTGYNVMVATDGETALEVANYALPDLILLDVMMPGIDGYETCRRLKANDKTAETPVVFLTARDETEGIIEGFESGGVDYVTKPFKKEELLLRIKTHLTLTRLARDLAELNEHLEQKVAERTAELRMKVSELEGKDRIAEHLLTFNSLEETLNLVLEVVAEILQLDRTAVFLKAEDGFPAAAAMGLSDKGVLAEAEQLQDLTLDADQERAFAEVEKSRAPYNLSEPTTAPRPFAAIPILRGDDFLGLIQVAGDQGPVTEAQIQTLTSFAIQAAVAINDAQIRHDPSAWAEQLDEVLELNEELEELEDAEQFEKLSKGLGSTDGPQKA